MVEKGLMKGAVFEDGSFYMVDKVLPSGDYISHAITKEEYEKVLKSAVPKRSTKKVE